MKGLTLHVMVVNLIESRTEDVRVAFQKVMWEAQIDGAGFI